jgi:hypothetical protein
MQDNRTKYVLRKTKGYYKKRYQTVEYRFSLYKTKAKQRGIPFTLSRLQFGSLWHQACFYCGSPISTIGIDRKDNKKGYTLANVVACCNACNMAKRANTVEQFISLCKRVAARF